MYSCKVIVMLLLSFIGIVCQPFTAPVEICPGDSPQFNCTVEDASGVSLTFWIVTVNETLVECIHTHGSPQVRTCGPNNEFESSPSGRDGNNFTSTLTIMSSISLSLNGTSVRCVGLTSNNVIGSDVICITGKIKMSYIIASKLSTHCPYCCTKSSRYIRSGRPFVHR